MRRWAFVIFVNIALLVAFLGAAEIAARIAFPCTIAGRIVPWSFVPGFGSIRTPNAVTLDTNRFDYCVEQRGNSMGFLDAEPPSFEAIKDKLRVALVGDSLVEATQVTPTDKVQNVLRQNLAAAGVDASVVAWGISGLGQVQELALFERFGRALHPNVVVLVIVYNDLKNNSWLMQALQDGVSPDTPSYVEIRPTEEGWEQIAPVANVTALPHRPSTPPPAWASWLQRNSTLYGYLLHLTSWNCQRLHALLAGSARADPLPDYLSALSRDPKLAPLLTNWPTAASDVDDAFEHRPWPRALDLAVSATEHAMDQWSELARRENFQLVALMSGEFNVMPAKAAIWRRILTERSIPTIWYGAAHPAGWHFLRDGHWNAQGHRWAAELLTRFLLERQHGHAAK
jgi:hypothetical protein